MHPIKFVWAARAIFYKAFFGKVGNLTYIGKPIFIEGRKNIYIGNRTRIFPGIRMEAVQNGKIEIGNNVAIQQNVHIASMGGVLRIGNDVTIAANCFFTNSDHIYADISKSVLEQNHILKDTYISDGCFIGYGAAIQVGTKLGKHCVVGTNSVVCGEFPDYCVLVGAPAKTVKKYDFEKKIWRRVN